MDCPDYLAEERAEVRLSGDADNLAIVRAAKRGLAVGGMFGLAAKYL